MTSTTPSAAGGGGHTPGPWTFSRHTDYGDVRFYVAQADGAPYTPDYSDVATLIAETVNSERSRIQEANARLIAAAPDLLASLMVILDHCDGYVTNTSKAIWRDAHAAVIKATGASQ
jgi:hypothetical protein